MKLSRDEFKAVLCSLDLYLGIMFDVTIFNKNPKSYTYDELKELYTGYKSNTNINIIWGIMEDVYRVVYPNNRLSPSGVIHLLPVEDISVLHQIENGFVLNKNYVGWYVVIEDI